MPLTDARCRSAQPGPRLKKLTDGGGLQLWLQPTGGRLWRLAYRFDGKQKLLALGVYPEVDPRKSDRGLSLVCREKDGPDDGQTDALWRGFQGEGCS